MWRLAQPASAPKVDRRAKPRGSLLTPQPQLQPQESVAVPPVQNARPRPTTKPVMPQAAPQPSLQPLVWPTHHGRTNRRRNADYG
jgi:hypothetical protein